VQLFKKTLYGLLVFFVLTLSLLVSSIPAEACGGTDVRLDDDPSKAAFQAIPSQNGYLYYDPLGSLILNRSEARISPSVAEAIVKRFARERVPSLKGGFRFRKLEYVHGKLVYQFESVERLPGYNGKYHLGPVNFIVDHVILDVDARTGELFLANGCGAAPAQLLARYDPREIEASGVEDSGPYISDNTNFIARKTGNTVNIDGRITEEEWKNTGHRYFYLGEYTPHRQGESHKKVFYHVEVWSQIADGKIYFAVKTDNPYWVGLMFKNDPNLGMLWSYTDAKVLRSNGEITDRHFMQRKDKTYFLEKDEKDDILAAAAMQDDLYTYEFAFPMKTGDRDDLEFVEGRAYNMLVLMGNTLDHYGIFTLDKAHKNHDHSKNNKEHVNVWASNETILRIGSPPKTDIFGSPVTPEFTSYVSGYDPSRNDTHFHYAAHVIKDVQNRSLLVYYINIATILLGVFGMAFLFVRTNGNQKTQPPGEREVDLFRFGPLRRFFRSGYYRALFTIPVSIFFVAIIIAGMVDVQDGRQNIATVYTWTIWWSLIIISFILFGRLWCMMCPFALAGDMAQKIVSLKKKLPGWLQNMGFQTLAFVVLTFAYARYSLYQKPLATSLLIIGILVAAVLTSMIFRRRTFCRYICPIGAVIGLYSLVSPFKLTSTEERRCINHRNKTCSGECPMLEDPYNLDSNLYCNYCMKCLPACPSDNLSLRYRGFGRDIRDGLRRSPVEAVASLFLFGIVLFETLAMTSALPALKKYIGGITGISSSGSLFSITYVGIVVLPAIVFFLFCYGLSKWLGRNDLPARVLLREFAFPFIPLGIGLHLAHNMNHLFVEAPVALPATVRLLQKAGLFSSFMTNWNPQPLIGGEGIFLLQMFTIIGGFIFTIYLLYRTVKRLEISAFSLAKTAMVMALYAVITVTVTFYMIGLPMNGRHVH